MVLLIFLSFIVLSTASQIECDVDATLLTAHIRYQGDASSPFVRPAIQSLFRVVDVATGQYVPYGGRYVLMRRDDFVSQFQKRFQLGFLFSFRAHRTYDLHCTVNGETTMVRFTVRHDAPRSKRRSVVGGERATRVRGATTSYTFTTCSSANRATLEQDFAAFMPLMENTQAYLEGGCRNTVYTRLFGALDATRENIVVQRVNNMLNLARTNLNQVCATDWTGEGEFPDGTCDDTPIAYVNPTDTTTIYWCSVYFNENELSAEQRQITVGHELSHFVYVSGPLQGSDGTLDLVPPQAPCDGGLAPCVLQLASSPDLAVQNAETYGTLVAEGPYECVGGSTGAPTQASAGGPSCCSEHMGTGCGNSACSAAVCGVDPACCETQWDTLCSEQAQETSVCGCAGTGTAGPTAAPQTNAPTPGPTAAPQTNAPTPADVPQTNSPTVRSCNGFDRNGDDRVGVDDLAGLLSVWGACQA